MSNMADGSGGSEPWDCCWMAEGSSLMLRYHTLPMLPMVPLRHNFQMSSDVFRCLQVLFSFHVRFQGAASVPCAYARTGCNSATNASAALCLHKTSDLVVAKMLRASESHCRLICPFAMWDFQALVLQITMACTTRYRQYIDVNNMMQQDRMPKYAQDGETYWKVPTYPLRRYSRTNALKRSLTSREDTFKTRRNVRPEPKTKGKKMKKRSNEKPHGLHFFGRRSDGFHQEFQVWDNQFQIFQIFQIHGQGRRSIGWTAHAECTHTFLDLLGMPWERWWAHQSVGRAESLEMFQLMSKVWSGILFKELRQQIGTLSCQHVTELSELLVFVPAACHSCPRFNGLVDPWGAHGSDVKIVQDCASMHSES